MLKSPNLELTHNKPGSLERITHHEDLLEQKMSQQRRLIQVLDVVDREINFENKRLKRENDSLHHFRVENEDLRKAVEQLNQQVSFSWIHLLLVY